MVSPQGRSDSSKRHSSPEQKEELHKASSCSDDPSIFGVIDHTTGSRPVPGCGKGLRFGVLYVDGLDDDQSKITEEIVIAA